MGRTIVTEKDVRAWQQERNQAREALRKLFGSAPAGEGVGEGGVLGGLAGAAAGASIFGIPSPSPPQPEGYTDRLLKYIPAESVALYLTLQGIVLSGVAHAPNLSTWLWLILGIGLVGTPLYQWRILKIGKVAQLAVSTAAFGVWVFALGGAFASLSWYEPFIGSLALVIFTFFAPLISPDVLSSEEVA